MYERTGPGGLPTVAVMGNLPRGRLQKENNWSLIEV